MKAYLWNILIALDQLVNTILAGDPDETISSRVAKRRNEPGWRIIAAFLEWIDPGHLDDAIEHDEGWSVETEGGLSRPS